MTSGRQEHELPTIEEVLRDPSASFWLKAALRSALARDPVDAAMIQKYWRFCSTADAGRCFVKRENLVEVLGGHGACSRELSKFLHNSAPYGV